MLTLLQTAPTTLQVVWYVLIAVLWTGYFFLEGFDYGVAMLIPIIGRDDEAKRRVVINTIGPVWDGNEVWLVTAGGATFAAFPGWYATEFSGLYLPLFLVLVGLIIRGISFEYRALRPSVRWHRAFDRTASTGSLLVALVLGIGFANFVRGIRLGPDQLMSQSLASLFNPFGLLGGVLFVSLFLTHGAVFLTLKTLGDVHDRAQSFARRSGLVSAALLAGFVVWQNLAWPASDNTWMNGSVACWTTGLLAVAALVIAWWTSVRGPSPIAFAATGAAIVLLSGDIWVKMYGNLGFTSDPGHPLDIVTASSSPHTLHLMTIMTCIFLPIVLAYQAWTYWVFRRRISTRNLPPDHGTEAPLVTADS